MLLFFSTRTDETEYEYSGSEDDEEDPQEQEGEPRYCLMLTSLPKNKCTLPSEGT